MSTQIDTSDTKTDTFFKKSHRTFFLKHAVTQNNGRIVIDEKNFNKCWHRIG